MSKSICEAYRANKNDEMYTPLILVECLKPYFENWCITQRKNPSQIKVWAPFDKTTSEYAFFFQKLGCHVKCSHIDYGQDFFTYEPEQYDIIVSNPPFSRKLDVFKRCNELGKPWVMLMNTMALNYNEIGNYFADNPVELLIPDKKISFDGNPSSFNSCYVCKDFLPTRLEFIHVEHNNTGNNFVPSRMYNA